MNAVSKMLCICIAVAAGTLTGLFFSNRLKARTSYYKALSELCMRFLSEVKFTRAPVRTILKEFSANGETPLNKNIGEYLCAAEPRAAVFSRGVLTKNEIAETQKFFVSLGCSDYVTQAAELEVYREKIAASETAATAAREKYSSVYIKLGFLAGLALGVLLL